MTYGNILRKHATALLAVSLLWAGSALAQEKVTIQVSNYNEGMSGEQGRGDGQIVTERMGRIGQRPKL